MAKTKTTSKKHSRKARKAAIARGESPAQPQASTKAGGPRPGPAQPAPISQDATPAQHPPVAPQGVTVRFSDSSRPRTNVGIDERMAEVELPAIRKDLRKLAITLSVFGVIFVGLAIVGTHTSMVQDLGDKLFTLWQ